MKSFTNKDGELRICGGTPSFLFLPILFTGADFSGPIGRNRAEEVIIMDRQTNDCNTHLMETSDARLLDPFGITFSCRTTDNRVTNMLIDLLSGRAVRHYTTGSVARDVSTTKGTTMNDGSNLNPTFLDSVKKAYNVEVKWLRGSGDHYQNATLGSYENMVLKYNEVYFDLAEQTIAEAEDSVTLSLNGMVYGTVVNNATTFTKADNATYNLSYGFNCS